MLKLEIQEQLGAPHVGVHSSFPIFKEMQRSQGTIAFRVRDRQLGHRLAMGYISPLLWSLQEAHGHIEVGQSGQMHLRTPP